MRRFHVTRQRPVTEIKAMRLLTTAAEINAELMRLLRACSSCQIAVAWASVGFKAFDLLAKNAKKIERMVIGTHFYQTHPDFIERFLTHPNVRFLMNPDGIFHRPERTGRRRFGGCTFRKGRGPKPVLWESRPKRATRWLNSSVLRLQDQRNRGKRRMTGYCSSRHYFAPLRRK
jgi:hypothetical protein